MKRQTKLSRGGFTLVELAIVMTIIGLLIGGILKGQELLENARVLATMSQLQGVNAAVVTFTHKYDGLPGDIINADRRVTGCNANCAVAADAAGCGGTGCGWDGKIGHPQWGSTGWVRWSCGIQQPPSDWSMEYDLFWLHLVKANLISGTRDISQAGATEQGIGISQMGSKLGGILYPGWADGTPLPGTGATPEGFIYVVGAEYPDCHDPMMDTDTGRSVSPVRAAQIDRKLDDGLPLTGSVLAFGDPASCAVVNGPQTEYNAAVTSKDCGLVIRPLN